MPSKKGYNLTVHFKAPIPLLIVKGEFLLLVVFIEPGHLLLQVIMFKLGEFTAI